MYVFDCVPHSCPSAYVQRSGLVSAARKVFRWRERTVGCKSSLKSHRSILMYHWIRALKPLRYRWVFCACSLNGLCKVLNCGLNFPCTLIFLSVSHLRQDIGDDPPILASGCFFNGSYFGPFHLSISLKCESPTVAQCAAVIVSVPFCPTRSPPVLHVKRSWKKTWALN